MMNRIRHILRAHSGVYDKARGLLMCWRRWRHGLRHVHGSFYMAPGSAVSADLVAHEFSYIGPDCMIGPGVELGAYAMIGPRVSIVGDDHRFDCAGVPIIFSGRPTLRRTVIGRDAWIGCGAVLLAGVNVGRGAIVAAGAVVTRDIPEFEIHGGVPARKLRDRFNSFEEQQVHARMLDAEPRRGSYCHPMALKEVQAA